MKTFTFDDIIGHKNTKEWLQNKLKVDKVPQVLLFVGAPGIGKTSMARVLACELACMDCPERLSTTKDAVIGNDKSTNAVKLYNMSTTKKDEEVANVINDLTVGLSDTGRKVVIMDEAHNISDQAQDSLLTRIENLEEHVYVIICTTDITCLRDALKSRCVTRNFLPPSGKELRDLIKKSIDANGIKFADMSEILAISFILASCNNEPRRCLNIIDSLDTTKPVTRDDLEQFGVYEEPKKYLTLVRYLYNNDIMRGLQFIEDLPTGFTDVSIQILLNMVKIVFNGDSKLLSQEIRMWLQENTGEAERVKLLQFVSKLATHGRLTKPYISGVFIELCMDVHKPIESTITRTENAAMIDKYMEQEIKTDAGVDSVPSLDDLMMQGESVI